MFQPNCFTTFATCKSDGRATRRPCYCLPPVGARLGFSHQSGQLSTFNPPLSRSLGGFFYWYKMENRDFKGVWIPAEIFLDENLSPVEKILLAEIDSLDNDPEKGCFASNEYLGRFIQKSEGTTANIISSLRKRGYLSQCFFDGRNRGLRTCYSRHISSEKMKAGFTKSLKQPSRNRESSLHENVNILIQSTNTGDSTSFPEGKEDLSACADNALFAEFHGEKQAKPQPKNQEEKQAKQSSANFAKKEYDLTDDAKEVLAFLSEVGSRAFAPMRGDTPTNALKTTVRGLKLAYKEIVLPIHKQALKSKAMGQEEAWQLAKQVLLDVVAFKAKSWLGGTTNFQPQTLFGPRHLLKYHEELEAYKSNPSAYPATKPMSSLQAQKEAQKQAILRASMNGEDPIF